MQALTAAPPEHSKPIYLQYALLEEQHGLAKHAMGVYARAVRLVPKPERMGLYELYLSKASEFFGIGKVNMELTTHVAYDLVVLTSV